MTQFEFLYLHVCYLICYEHSFFLNGINYWLQNVILSHYSRPWTCQIRLWDRSTLYYLFQHLSFLTSLLQIRTSLQVLTLQREGQSVSLKCSCKWLSCTFIPLYWVFCLQQVSVKRQKTAFPPNFVHSLDGSHMMMTAISCKNAGLHFAGLVIVVFHQLVKIFNLTLIISMNSLVTVTWTSRNITWFLFCEHPSEN